MVKVVKRVGLFEVTEEYEYRPTIEELYYWYSGTHAGLDRNNPYAPKRTSATRVKYRKVG